MGIYASSYNQKSEIIMNQSARTLLFGIILVCLTPLCLFASNEEYIHIPELETGEYLGTIANAYRSPSGANDQDNKSTAGAQQVMQQVESNNLWTESLNTADLSQLPIGIMHTKGQEYGSSGGDNVEYTVAVSKARFFAEYTELTVYARLRIPQTDGNGKKKELFFGADNIILSHSGGIIGDARLALLSDIYIPFGNGAWEIVLKGGFDPQRGEINSQTYVSINCDGVSGLSLDGDVVFSKSLVVPVINGQPDSNRNVKGSFLIQATGWNDLLAEVSISPFILASQLQSFEEQGAFIFSAQRATLDLSDFRNSPNILFPDTYRQNGLLGPSPESWRGVYFNEVSVALPAMFKEGNSPEPVRLAGYNLLIDNYGVSGIFSAENLISLDKGRTSEQNAWAYSVDYFGLELVCNQIASAAFEGQLLLPLSKESETLSYQGLISAREYRMRVELDSAVNFNLWSASAELLPNSSVELAVVEHQFRPKAHLFGSLTMAVSSNPDNASDVLLKARGIEFQNMVLQTTKPYFAVDYMGYKGEISLGGFPVSISDIGVRVNEHELALALNIQVGLMESADKGFSVEGRVAVCAISANKNNRQTWNYKRIDISTFSIDANLGAVGLKGNLHFRYDDPTYGKGFYANLDASFSKTIGPLRLEAQFGKKDFRYWYVDGSVEGLKIPFGAVVFTGFSGGASYRMSRKLGANILAAQSGLAYVPDAKVGIGVRAAMFGSVISDKALSLKAGFEITTTRSGGIARMGLFGEASVMKAIGGVLGDLNGKLAATVEKQSDAIVNALDKAGAVGEIANKGVDKLADKSMYDRAKEINKGVPPGIDATIKATMGIEYDFMNSVLHGELEIFINTPGNILTGVGPGGLAGWAVLHCSKEANYLYIGTPDNPVGIKAGIGSAFIKTTSYFMVGDKIPGSPPPPPQVARILGLEVSELDYMRDENALGNGKGFAFGSHFSMDTGDMTFLILYARFQAGLGMDIMLKDYGEAVCVNRGNDQIGIDGWYANGQAYVYLEGELGIKIKLFFVNKKIPIIKGGAAVLLQAKAPNPFWMRGYIGGYYDLLNGLVKGKFRFKMELGEQCELAETSPLGGIKMIASVAPNDGDKDVDVFAMPEVAFAMKVGEELIIPEDEGDRFYRVVLERFDVLNKEGKAIDGTIKWNNTKDVASFVSADILPSEQDFKVAVEVSFQERINGVYQTIKVDGKKAVEYEERKFTSGTAPSVIPLHNVEYAYPVIEQQNFYKKEHPQGYLALKRGQDYLFDDGKWNSSVFFISDNKDAIRVDFNYNTKDNKINYTMPKLDNKQQYRMAIVSYPLNTEIDTKQLQGRESNPDEMAENTMEINTKEAKLKVNAATSQVERLAYNFRSSRYNTFAQKIKSIRPSKNNWGKLASDLIYLTSRINANEPFDLAELTGNAFTEQPLVNIKATLSDSYFKEQVAPVVYNNYPLDGQFYLRRDDARKTGGQEPENIGIPPSGAIPVLSSYLVNLEQDIRHEMVSTTFPYMYNLPVYYKNDLLDLQGQVANQYVDKPNSINARALKILSAKYPFMREGNYEVELQYCFPDGSKGSKAIYKYRNNLKFNPE